MKRIIFYLVILAAAAFYFLVLAPSSENSALAHYFEECVHEGCSGHEIEELYESYDEECFGEGCSKEEVFELAVGGYRGPGYTYWVTQFMNELQSRGYVINPEHFQTSFGDVCGPMITKCYGVVMFCDEQCVYSDGSTSSPYACGVCFGFSW